MTTRDTLLFAALSGTPDCPLQRLQNLAHTLRLQGLHQQASTVQSLARHYLDAEAALTAAANSPETVPGARYAALTAHRRVLSHIQAIFAPKMVAT